MPHSSSVASSIASLSPYKGTAYRSVAFGTWAVGDAGRCFSARRRGKSTPALEKTGGGQGPAEENPGGGGGRTEQCARMRERLGSSPLVSPPQHPTDLDHPPVSASSSPPHSLSLGDIRILAQNRRKANDTEKRGGMDVAMKHSDLYSSTEYARHGNRTNADGENVVRRPLVGAPSSNTYSRQDQHGRSLEALFQHSSCPSSRPGGVPFVPSPSPLSTCPSRTSCPPLSSFRVPSANRRPALLRHCLLHSPPSSARQFAFIVDPLARGGMRTRTKSLDNGLKLPLRRRKDRICGGDEVPTVASSDAFGSERVVSSRKTSAQQPQLFVGGPAESRLESAKNFIRRFYASSTLRLTGKRRKGSMPQQGRESGRKIGGSTAPTVFNTAISPFFELRRPCPEEVPFLPYNIHYAIESGSDSADEAEQNTSAMLPPSALLWMDKPDTPTPTSPVTTLDTPMSGSVHSSARNPTTPFGGSHSSPACSSSASPHQPAGSGGTATTPSAGYGSLRGSDSEGETGKVTTGKKERMAMESVERHFADWNEQLFQYLKREIMEMQLRDTQILRSLEEIECEMNGVRSFCSMKGRGTQPK